MRCAWPGGDEAPAHDAGPLRVPLLSRGSERAGRPRHRRFSRKPAGADTWTNGWRPGWDSSTDNSGSRAGRFRCSSLFAHRPIPTSGTRSGSRRAGAGESDKAIEAFEQALRLDPKNAVAWQNIGLTRVHANRPQDALGAFDRAFALNERLPGPGTGGAPRSNSSGGTAKRWSPGSGRWSSTRNNSRRS